MRGQTPRFGRDLRGRSFAIFDNSMDPRGRYLVHSDPAVEWNGGAAVLRRCRYRPSFSLAMQFFISQYEYAAHAHDVYGHGTVTWASYEEARADAEVAVILLGGYLRLMDYAEEGVKLAIEEMKQSKRRWFPAFAACLEQENYAPLSLYV